MSLPRILLFLTDLEFGGTPTVVRELALRLRTQADIQVACLGKWGPVAGELSVADIQVTALAATGSADVRVLPRFLHLLTTEKIDTVFSFLLHANAVAAAACRIGSPPHLLIAGLISPTAAGQVSSPGPILPRPRIWRNGSIADPRLDRRFPAARMSAFRRGRDDRLRPRLCENN